MFCQQRPLKFRPEVLGGKIPIIKGPKILWSKLALWIRLWPLLKYSRFLVLKWKKSKGSKLFPGEKDRNQHRQE